jgi:hypothetical protein
MRDPQNLPKAMLWIFLVAVTATALVNGVRLGEALWLTWQMESTEASRTSVPQVSNAAIVLAYFGR